MKQVLRVAEEGLKSYIVAFTPESNKRFVETYLSRLTGRDRDELFGYEPKAKGSAGNCSHDAIKKGRYPAYRIRIMCRNLNGKVDHAKIKSEFNNTVECRSKNFCFEVGEDIKDAVWLAIGEGL